MKCCNCEQEATTLGGYCYSCWEKLAYIPSLEEVKEPDDICPVCNGDGFVECPECEASGPCDHCETAT